MSWRARYGLMNAYDVHKIFINEYLLTRKGSTSLLTRDTSRDKRDIEVIRENHQFLWDDKDEIDSWEKRIAKKYYDRLFKEFCVGDLTRYKEDKFGFRWRTEKELIDGKGQFSCGGRHCSEEQGLKTWEVNFGYVEHGVQKTALVKLRLCSRCSKKLNYRFKKKEVKRLRSRCESSVGTSQPSASSTTADEAEADPPSPKAWQSNSQTTSKNDEQELDDFLQHIFF